MHNQPEISNFTYLQEFSCAIEERYLLTTVSEECRGVRTRTEMPRFAKISANLRIRLEESERGLEPFILSRGMKLLGKTFRSDHGLSTKIIDNARIQSKQG